MSAGEEVGLRELKNKLAEEERVYAELLAKLDAVADSSPFEVDAELSSAVSRLNEIWEVQPLGPEPRPRRGLKGLVRGLFRRLAESELAPLGEALARQQAFNSKLVQFLNRYMDAVHRRSARQGEFDSALVRFAQRIDRLADAKDRLYASLGNTRSDLLIEAGEKRMETLALGLKRTQDRLEGLISSVELARAELASLRRRTVPTPEPASAETSRPAESPAPLDAPEYVAFENRFRGPPEEIRHRLTAYVSHFQGRSPVVELGCGRGEMLELLGEAGIEARGVDNNREMVEVCRQRGLNAVEADLVSYLKELPPESVGGIFAAQVIEHLSPALLRDTLAECHRTLRKGGCLVLETVNPRSVVALVESFYRDLTHQKPIHPETLDFLLRACGFREVKLEYASPVSERAKLLTLSPEGENARTLNENIRKLNALLFAHQDYAAIATK